MTLFPFSKGKCLVWDFTCVDSFSLSSLQTCSISPGSAAEKAEENKKIKYAALAENFIFSPIAVETTGCFGKDSLAFLKSLGRSLMQARGTQRKCLTSLRGCPSPYSGPTIAPLLTFLVTLKILMFKKKKKN